MAITDEHPGQPGTDLPPAPPAPPERSRWRVRPTVALGAVVGAGTLAYLATIDPSTSSAYPPCPLKVLTGVDCAGCGGLRCTHALLTGDIERAADHNLLLVLAVPFVAYLVVRKVLAATTGHRLPAPRLTTRWAWAAFALLMVFSVVRNLPWGPMPYLFSDANGTI